MLQLQAQWSPSTQVWVHVCGSCIHTWLVSVCKYLYTWVCSLQVRLTQVCVCVCAGVAGGVGRGWTSSRCTWRLHGNYIVWSHITLGFLASSALTTKCWEGGSFSAYLHCSCLYVQSDLYINDWHVSHKEPTSPIQTLPSTQPAADGTRWDRVVSGSSYFPPLSSLSMSPESILGSLCRCWSAESDSAWWRRRRTDVPLMVHERNYPKPTVNNLLPTDHTHSFFPLWLTHTHTHTNTQNEI